MSLFLSTVTFGATNIYSPATAVTVATYLNNTGAAKRIGVRASLAALTATAANFNWGLFTASLGSTSTSRFAAPAKMLAAATTWNAYLGEHLLLNGETMNVEVRSSNAGDTVVTGQINFFDMCALDDIQGAVIDAGETLSLRIWHVSKLGLDTNGGHSYADAKLTIGAAVTAAASGDTIIIWPGNYAEYPDTTSKAVTIIGKDTAYTRITPASGNALLLGHKCSARDLSVIAASGGIGLIINGADVEVRNCYVTGTGSDALSVYANTTRMRLIDTIFYAEGHVVQGGSGTANNNSIYAKNCIFEGWGAYGGECFSLIYPAPGIYEDCHFILNNTATGAGVLAAVSGSYLTTHRPIKAIFKHCRFQVNAVAGRTGIVCGIYSNNASSIIILDRCLFETVGAGAALGPIDIYNAAGTVIASNCAYSTSYGTITQGGSGWSAALLSALFASANKLAVDASGRVDLGSIMGATLDDYNAILKLKGLDIQRNDGENAINAIAGSGGTGAAFVSTGISGDGVICQGGVEMGNGLVCTGGGGDIDAAEIDALPALAATAILAKTGITVGGTWTLAEIIKLLISSEIGKLRSKAGAPLVKEYLDAEDGATPVFEQTPSENSPYRSTEVL